MIVVPALLIINSSRTNSESSSSRTVGARNTSNGVGAGLRPFTSTCTCHAVEAQISADTTQDMRGTLLITIPVVTTSAVVVSADTIALVLECYYAQNY